MEILEPIAAFIREVGFPIAVAGFLLVRMNGKLDRLAEALRDNTDATRALGETVTAAQEGARK